MPESIDKPSLISIGPVKGEPRQSFVFKPKWKAYINTFSIYDCGLIAVLICFHIIAMIGFGPQDRYTFQSAMIRAVTFILLGFILTFKLRFPLRITADQHGIGLHGGISRKGQRHAWAELSWREDSSRIFWLVWSGHWLRIDPERYSFGTLLVQLIKERCAPARPPSGIISLIPASDPFSQIMLAVDWSGHYLMTHERHLDTRLPMEARFLKAGGLSLRQADAWIPIHPHDPRRAEIEAIPEVAKAIEKMSKSHIRKWRRG